MLVVILVITSRIPKTVGLLQVLKFFFDILCIEYWK